jgi:CDP-paratose 2-epimerase
MGIVVITGSAGLIGSAAVRLFADKGLDVVGVDNDMRRTFFGAQASTEANRRRLEADIGCRHVDADIRDTAATEAVRAAHDLVM